MLSIPAASLLLCLIAAPAAAAGDPWFEQAWNSPDGPLLTAWGQRYEKGVGVPRDARKAVRLYCKAAQRGEIEAQYALGRLYATGQGVSPDRAQAAAWLTRASQAGHALAAVLLKVRQLNPGAAPRPDCDRGDPPATRLAARRPPASGEIAQLVRTLAPKYRLDPELVLAAVEAESNFNPQAKSPKKAQGLMQLIPETAARFGLRDVWDPEQNLRGGMAYLRWLLDRFDGDVPLALAGYNAGEGAVERHGGVPPYRETQAYVERILRRIGHDVAETG